MVLTVICSGCGAEVTLNPAAGYVVVNADEAALYDDGEMFTWDCPSCDYPDSYWPTFDSDQWKEYRDGW